MKGVSGLEKVIVGVIYEIINLVDGKIYIGQTTQSLKLRFGQHARTKSYIGNAIRRYGKENFICEVIEECATAEQLDERERFWIAEFDCIYPRGYNRTPGGDSVRGGCPPLNLKRSISAKRFWNSKTPEERSATARKSAVTRNANSTPEERSKILKKSAATIKAEYEAKSPEEQAIIDKKCSEIAKKRAATKTPEEKSVSAKKAAATRKAKYEAQTIEEKALTDLKRSEAVKKGRAKMSPKKGLHMLIRHGKLNAPIKQKNSNS